MADLEGTAKRLRGGLRPGVGPGLSRVSPYGATGSNGELRTGATAGLSELGRPLEELSNRARRSLRGSAATERPGRVNRSPGDGFLSRSGDLRRLRRHFVVVGASFGVDGECLVCVCRLGLREGVTMRFWPHLCEFGVVGRRGTCGR